MAQPDAPISNAVLQLRDDVVSTDLGEQAVLLHLTTGDLTALNPVAARMLRVLQTSTSLEQARKRLLAEYEVEPDRLLQDLKAYVQTLVSEGLAEAPPEFQPGRMSANR